MTNEEAKQIISDIDYAWRNFSRKEYVALEIAIKAIEQNREIREIVNHRWASGVNNNALCTVKHIREVIEE